MTNETEDVVEQSTDSLLEDPNLSSDDMQTKIAELEAEKKDLNSRVGDMARKMGEQERDLEGKYQEWYTGLQSYYDEQLKSKDGAINILEDRLIEVDDTDGAKTVLEERKQREQVVAQAEEDRRSEQANRQQILQNTIQQAIGTFTDVDPSALSSAATPQEVWRMAGDLNKRVQDSKLDERMNALKEELLSAVTPTREAEVPAQEEASRTPGSSRGSETASMSRRDGGDTANAELNQLEEALLQARKQRNLPKTVALQGQLHSLKRQLGLQ
tara:strand:- start:8259 stop:9071 length:813 start_codon:yes stop_codon:yes gene_type:complete